MHDIVTKGYRHLNFFQHECHLQVRTPRVKLPNSSVRLVEPDFAERLNGFMLLFEAFLLMLARQMPFAAVARIVGESHHRVLAVCQKYMEMACGLADYSEVKALAIDKTSRARSHSYVTLAADADADARHVLFVTEGRDVKTIEQLTMGSRRRTSLKQASICRRPSLPGSASICPTPALHLTNSPLSTTPARR